MVIYALKRPAAVQSRLCHPSSIAQISAALPRNGFAGRECAKILPICKP